MKSRVAIFSKAFIVAAFLSGTGNIVNGQQQASLSVKPVTTDKIRFIGEEGDMLVFELHIDNPQANGSWLKIYDGDNNVIFEEKITDKSLLRRYKIERADIKRITFSVNGKSYSFSQSFTINYKVEEFWEVTKA
jgi:hypothetical protein